MTKTQRKGVEYLVHQLEHSDDLLGNMREEAFKAGRLDMAHLADEYCTEREPSFLWAFATLFVLDRPWPLDPTHWEA